MKRLLNIEFHKFRYSKSSKVLTIIYLVIVGLLMLTGIIPVYNNGDKVSLASFGFFDFPFIWHLSTYILSFLKILIAIVLVSLTASEYSNRTLKQNLIDGLSKKELILSKFYFATVLALLTTLVIFIATLTLGLIYSSVDKVSIVFSDLEYVLAFFISHLVFFFFCLFAGVLVKRSAFALGLVGIWWIFEQILYGLSMYLKGKFDLEIWDTLKNILPLESASLLIKEPFSKIDIIGHGINTVTQGLYENNYSVSWINIVTCLVWSFLFIYWSYILLKRRDL